MNITTSTGSMILDDDAQPSIDDMNDIISSLTRDDAQFQALCNASVSFPSATVSEFHAACEAWIAEHELSSSQKAALAAKAIKATKVDAGWVYFDDSTREYYLCEDQEEMADLYDLQHSDNSDIASDAYSHWCAGTSHSECDENGVIPGRYTAEDIALEKRLAAVANEEGTIQAYDMLQIAPHSAPQLHTTMSVKAAFTALTGKAYDTDFFCD